MDVLVALSANRTAEHEAHGWMVDYPMFAVQSMERFDGYWMSCSCGWHGWIVKDPDNPPKETFNSSY